MTADHWFPGNTVEEGEVGIDSKGAHGNFEGDTNVPWFDWDGYAGVDFCQNSLSYTAIVNFM